MTAEIRENNISRHNIEMPDKRIIDFQMEGFQLHVPFKCGNIAKKHIHIFRREIQHHNIWRQYLSSFTQVLVLDNLTGAQSNFVEHKSANRNIGLLNREVTRFDMCHGSYSWIISIEPEYIHTVDTILSHNTTQTSPVRRQTNMPSVVLKMRHIRGRNHAILGSCNGKHRWDFVDHPSHYGNPVRYEYDIYLKIFATMYNEYMICKAPPTHVITSWLSHCFRMACRCALVCHIKIYIVD